MSTQDDFFRGLYLFGGTIMISLAIRLSRMKKNDVKVENIDDTSSVEEENQILPSSQSHLDELFDKNLEVNEEKHRRFSSHFETPTLTLNYFQPTFSPYATEVCIVPTLPEKTAATVFSLYQLKNMKGTDIRKFVPTHVNFGVNHFWLHGHMNQSYRSHGHLFFSTTSKNTLGEYMANQDICSLYDAAVILNDEDAAVLSKAQPFSTSVDHLSY